MAAAGSAAAAPLVLATRSADKAREIRAILAGARHPILTLEETGLAYDPAEEAVEDADTFLGNARAKARYYAARTGRPVVADDSGLVVDALDGAPGVYSKRFSGRADLAGLALDRANNDLLLLRLQGVPEERRTARYVCAAVLAWPGDPRPPLAAIGTCEGLIATAASGDGGFGYDPLFLVPELGATFGTLPADEKNRRSHRGRAFRALAGLIADEPGI
jgi:XTP/dITP diphosphohydrolase